MRRRAARAKAAALSAALGALFAAGAGPAAAADGGPDCTAAELPAAALNACLAEAVKRSDRDMEAAVATALAAIAARPGIFDTQRARWRNALTDSQNDWLRFRNSECQNVAPFEGQTGGGVLKNRVAAFEAKLVCTIRLNGARIADLAARYPAP